MTWSHFIQQTMYLFLVALVLSMSSIGPRHGSHFAEGRVVTGLECNPHQAKMSCLVGCFGCFKAYGVELYDMAACCRTCRLSHAVMVDDGPSKCSYEYIKSSWLKRIG